MTTPEYSLDDIESDLGHLYHLLDIAVETLIEVDHGESPSNRPYLERLGAILWIARDRALGIVDDFGIIPPGTRLHMVSSGKRKVT